MEYSEHDDAIWQAKPMRPAFGKHILFLMTSVSPPGVVYSGYQRFFLVFDEELSRPSTRLRPKAEETSGEAAGHFLRLDRNRKPRMKSLWHPG